MLEIFFSLGTHHGWANRTAKGTGYANRLWPPNVDHIPSLHKKFSLFWPKICSNEGTEWPPYAWKNCFHLEQIMGEPMSPAKVTGRCANRLWPPNVVHFSILDQKFDLIWRKICTQKDRLMWGKIFLLGTHHGRANRPCEGYGVSEKPMVEQCGLHFSLGQNFHYNIDVAQNGKTLSFCKWKRGL